MAKTDKTRPWRVRATDRPMVTCTPVHRHEHGPCTLPADPRDRFGFEKDLCYWDASTEFWHTGDGFCGCAYCSDQQERKATRRRERRKARKDTQDARRAWRSIDTA